MIKIKDRKKVVDVLSVDEIPITYTGLLECNIDNCLAAVSAAYALDIDTETIREGLATFRQNPGRFQLFDMQNYKILLDYAHNQAGYEQIINLCKKVPCCRRVGIIGMPGDRTDDSIKTVGALAAKAFDIIYVKEDIDLRGRQKDEVSQLLRDSIVSEGFESSKIIVMSTETEALKQAMTSAEQGDFIITLFENMEPLIEIIEQQNDRVPLL